MHQRFLFLAGLLGLLGVLAGTFGAHGLEDTLNLEKLEDRKTLATYETGVKYHLLHAVALLGVSLLATTDSRKSVAVAGYAFTMGILIFSGSLYVIVFTGITKFGMVAPIGGLSFMIGWVSLMCAGWKRKA